jgi:predicted transcriptional regulator
MRNAIFEAAVLNNKLQTVFLDQNCKIKLADLESDSNIGRVEGWGRTSIAVIGDILAFCQESQNTKKIQSKINLSNAQTARYLEYLFYHNLLSKNKDQYVVTPKGQSLQRLFVKLRGFFGVNRS